MFGKMYKEINKVTGVIKGTYYDGFKWSVVKSIAFFALGIKIALECKGMDIMPPVTV